TRIVGVAARRESVRAMLGPMLRGPQRLARRRRIELGDPEDVLRRRAVRRALFAGRGLAARGSGVVAGGLRERSGDVARTRRAALGGGSRLRRNRARIRFGFGGGGG